MMFMGYRIFIAFALVIVAAGCTQYFGSSQIVLEPETSLLTPSTPFKVFVSVVNNEGERIRDIKLSIFDTGIMLKQDSCEWSISELKPEQKINQVCNLRSPEAKEIPEPFIRSPILASMRYKKNFAFLTDVEIITFDEYERRRLTGTLESYYSGATYSDNNIEADLEFSEDLPLVHSSGKEIFMYLKIRNIGGGFLGPIGSDKIKIIEGNSLVDEGLNCLNSVEGKIYPINNEFPRIACKLVLPSDGDINSGRIGLNIEYEYEIRAETSVEVKK